MFHSIKTRLTLFYTLIVFLLFIISAGLLYFGLQKLLISQLDHELHLYADVIEDSYNPQNNSFEFLEEGTELSQAIRRDWVRILRTDSTIVFNSDRFAETNIRFPFKKAVQLKLHDSMYREFSTVFGRNYRSIILPVRNDKMKSNFGWVEVAKSTHDLYHPIKALRKLMVLATPFILLVIGLISYFMVQRSFRPLAGISKKINEISSSNLEDRLPVENPHDEIGQIAIQFNDLLQRLDMSFKKQTRLLTDVAHELKTPLAVLRSHWEQEAENELLPVSLRYKLSSDIEEIARLSKMVNDLLLLSQSEHKEPPFKFESVNMGILLNIVVDDMRVLAAEKKQKIVLDSDQPATVSADEHYLRRLFTNLLDNAIKYSPNGSEIKITLRQRDGMAETKIEDNGIGISEEELPFIFDRLYRSNKARSRRQGGNGLGLSICRWIVAAHGGSITVESEPDKGTTFSVFLPLTE